MSDNDEPEDRRTEGVRIIGAQEAAEAAARPDVVRRRSRREKRYGDRPDEPEAASDLPKITISTTETEGPADTDRYGPAPVVRPEDDAGGGDPRWADDDREPEPDPRAGFGHARILAAQDPAEDPPYDEQHQAPAPSTWAAEPEPNWAATDEPPVPAGAERPDEDATQQWSSSDFAQEWSAQDVEDEPEAPLAPTWDPEESRSEFGTFEPAAAGAEPEDDSFVLPHWTEPPTGQVPRVIIGEDAPEPESLATYGSQPRWRDEGERDVVTGFDDLIDEEPGLGALRDDDVEDAFFADQDYDDDGYLVEGDEDLEPYDEDYDDELLPPPPRRRRTPSRRARSDDDVGGGHRGGGDRDMVTAVGVGLALVAVGLVCFTLGSLPTAILATVVVTVAAWEYFSAVRSSGYNPATLLGMASVIGVMLAAFTSGLSAYPVVLGLSVVAGLLWYLWVAPGEGAVQNLGLTMLGVMWVGVLGSFATLFLGLGRIIEDGDSAVTSNPGIGVLIAAVIATVSHDIGAYFVGRFFGRTPLSAASPNKTQEGLAGGVLTSLVVTVGVVGIIGIEPIGADLPQTFVFALLCAIVAPLGDLAESFVKRDLAIKDMGSVLPGHGGVLDRFDGMLFVLPMAYFVTLLFDIWTGSGT